MANIAGGIAAGGVLEGQKEFRTAEAQNIQNQSAQLDLNERNDAHRAYTQAMDAYMAQKKQKKASEQAQVAPTESALGAPAPAPQATATPTSDLSAEINVPAGAQVQPGLAPMAPSGYNPPLQAQPQATAPANQAPAPSALAQTPAPAPAAAAPAAPAPAPTKEDGFLSKLAKTLGIEPKALSDVPRTPGAMKGLMAAQQHVEQFQKQEIQQDINQMFRANVSKSEPEQIAAAVAYGKDHNIPGAPDSFVAVKGENGQVVGWKALHDGAQEGGMIPNTGHGFLDSYTRVLYGAVDRMGSIGTGIEQESALGMEREKGTQKVRAEEAKGKSIGAVQSQRDKAAMEREQERGKTSRANASTAAGARVQAARERTAGDEKISKKIEVLVKQKNAITNASKDITGASKPSPEDQKRLAKIEAQISKYNAQMRGGESADESDDGGAAGSWAEYDK